MTSGRHNGTSGGALRIGPWLTIALVGALVVVVNVTSELLEAQRDGDDMHWAEPFVWEASSYLMIVALAPAIGRAIKLVPPKPANLLRFALTHGALTIPFSLFHVGGFVALREGAYWTVGERYGFFDDGLALPLVYEWRKDVLTYAILAAVYWLFQFRAERAQAFAEERIEIRDGAATVFLAPLDILLVEAAGNYVEFHTGQRQFLVRGTLAAWEQRLSRHGFARVHRSRLVNRRRISTMKPTPAGDLDITLDTGRSLLGSRRYRTALEARLPST